MGLWSLGIPPLAGAAAGAAQTALSGLLAPFIGEFGVNKSLDNLGTIEDKIAPLLRSQGDLRNDINWSNEQAKSQWGDGPYGTDASNQLLDQGRSHLSGFLDTGPGGWVKEDNLNNELATGVRPGPWADTAGIQNTLNNPTALQGGTTNRLLQEINDPGSAGVAALDQQAATGTRSIMDAMNQAKRDTAASMAARGITGGHAQRAMNDVTAGGMNQLAGLQSDIAGQRANIQQNALQNALAQGADYSGLLRGQTLDAALGQRGQDVQQRSDDLQTLLNQRGQNLDANLQRMGLGVQQRGMDQDYNTTRANMAANAMGQMLSGQANQQNALMNLGTQYANSVMSNDANNRSMLNNWLMMQAGFNPQYTSMGVNAMGNAAGQINQNMMNSQANSGGGSNWMDYASLGVGAADMLSGAGGVKGVGKALLG